ncbi:PEP-CTERM sorting domain-containing protein [Oxalobacteraceae bacterium]|nr:PEP-CTERM sorting domain-containing protein [Oxalobacteraceae bacterium]
MTTLSRLLAPFALTLAVFATPASANIATTASVYFNSTPGSWVGGAVGAPVASWVHGIDGIFFGGINFDQGVHITYDDGHYWNFDFAAPTFNPSDNSNDGQPLHVGLYNNATRFPFNSPTKPGMDISGNGRGNNQSSGWFNVLDIAYGQNGNIDRFAVDFRQFDETQNQTGTSLYGSLRFNSAIPLTPVPEPTTVLLLIGGLAALGVARRVSKAKVALV